MKAFAALYSRLDSSNATLDKVAAMRDYFRSADPKDAAWALFILTGSKLKGTVNTRVFAEAAAQASGLPDWIIGECYSHVGDFSETVALLLPPSPATTAAIPLHEVFQQIVLPTIGATPEAQRETLIRAWQGFDERERLTLNKIFRGAFRAGVQRKLVVRALAEAKDLDAATLEARLTGGLEPTAEAYLGAISPTPTAADARRPHPFMLANPIDPAHQAAPGELLGDLAAWHAEWKYDGTRVQILHRGREALLWSRGEELINGSFPEIAALARRLPEGTVLDAELLLWEDDRPRPFAALQRRLNRKAATSAQTSLFDRARIVAVAFDALEIRGADLRNQPLSARRDALEALIAELAGDETLQLAPALRAASWADLAAQRSGARELGVEGVMLKHRASLYIPGRARTDAPEGSPGGWWKWKLDPYSVDAVLVHAQPGSGKRAGLYTDYTFALWDESSGERRLVPFAKAYSGLTQEEIQQVDAFVRRSTVAKSGPVRTVRPELVFEIGFEGIQESTRHKSGLAVRFPRILRWRHDKKPADADTLATLQRLFNP